MGHHSQTREKILRTASSLFWHKGFESTGVSEILKKTGVGAGSLYWFFDSKEDILLAVLDHYRDMLEQQIARPALDASDDPVERILHILEFYRNHLIENSFELGCPIGNVVLELGDRYPAVRRKTEELFEVWRDMIARCVDHAVGKSEQEIDVGSLSIFVLTIMEGGLVQARAHQDIRYFDESVKHLRAYLVNTLATGEV